MAKADRRYLKRFLAQAGIVIPNTHLSTVVLGTNYDMGSVGSCRCDDLYLESGEVWFTLIPNNQGGEPMTFFFLASGTGEPLAGKELEAHLKKLTEREKPASKAKEVA